MEEAEQIWSELLVERVFDAPRELVWKAWTEPGYLKRWWGPKGFTAPAIEIDLRVGGRYLYGMRSPEGQDFWSTGEFREGCPARADRRHRLVCGRRRQRGSGIGLRDDRRLADGTALDGDV
ncbi:Activator of Hsp90 ATPase -like protein [anaerobic digester metagenome]